MRSNVGGKVKVYWVVLTGGVQEESVDCAVIFPSQLNLIALVWFGQVDPAWRRLQGYHSVYPKWGIHHSKLICLSRVSFPRFIHS